MISLAPDLAEPDKRYRAVLDWIWAFSARTRSAAEIAAQRAVKLERMRALLHFLGDPETTFPSLLVAGTKGKGSTVAMIAAGLQVAGRRTGRYTSPHLVNWRERTCIDAQPIEPGEVVDLAPAVHLAVDSLPPSLGQPTTFEVGTAFAFLYFQQKQVDVAVLEVGVGGRYDATNVVEPLVSVITPISYDHTATLGNALAAIASHKAGILRPGRPGVIAPQPQEAMRVIESEAARLDARLERVGIDWSWTSTGMDSVKITSRHSDFAPLRARLALLGDHQRDNATAAVAALHALGRVRPQLATSRAAIVDGLEHVRWPGRLQVVNEQPLVVFDGAHNGASAEALRRAIEGVFGSRRVHLILGLTAGKDARGVLDALLPAAATVRLTRSRHERSADPAELEPLVRAAAPAAAVLIETDIAHALESGLRAARPEDLVLVTGSLFLVGEALVWWQTRSSR